MAKDIKEITEQLERGVKDVFRSDKYQEYLKFMSKFYNYSVNNIILIMMQKPDASLVAGYRAWQTKFNRQVRKGEKGITILAPCTHKRVKEVDGEETEVSWTSFRATKVFDISQTDGEDIPTGCVDMLTGDVADFEALLTRLKDVSPVGVFFEDIQGGANGFFSHTDKRIVVRSGMSQSQTIKTLVHEISHAILHDKELGLEKDADRYTREVQAESVAYTVCSMLGLDTSDYSFGYVAGWSSGKDVKELNASMETIRRTAKDIFESLAVA